jgi:hypothetical protein
METKYPASDIDSAVDESVKEALLMAEFFRGIHKGQNGEVLQPDSITPVQLEKAREYLEQPIGIDIFAPSIENNRRPGFG